MRRSLASTLALLTALSALAVVGPAEPADAAVRSRREFICYDVDDDSSWSAICDKVGSGTNQTITVTPGKLLCFAVRGSEGVWVQFQAFRNGSRVGRTSFPLRLGEGKDCVYRNQTGSNVTVYFKARQAPDTPGGDPTGIEVDGTAYVQDDIDD